MAPHDPGRTVERLYVVPSALRTLSVVTLLSAVSGTVLIANTQHHDSTASTAEANLDGGSFASAALLSRIPAQRTEAAARLERQNETDAKIAGLQKDRTRILTVAKAATKAKAEARAERSRQAIRERASRSARRNPRALAKLMVADRGWGSGQFSCLNSLWNRESRWNLHAANPSSGAYGIPQALPGRKMASAGPDWRNNPVTQIRWGLNYIADRYRTPCGAWAHSQSSGWY